MTPEAIFVLTALPLCGAALGWTLRGYVLRAAQLRDMKRREHYLTPPRYTPTKTKRH